MNPARVEFKSPNCIHVIGEIDYDNVSTLLSSGQVLMQPHDNLHIDLHEVRHPNSVGVALLTEWLRFAKAHNKQIIFQRVPEPMLAIIELGGLAKLLPIAA